MGRSQCAGVLGEVGILRLLSPLLVAGMLLAIAGCGASSGSQQSGYPEQDVRFLVGVSAGGGFDAFARTLAPYLEEKLPGDGKVVVENLTGAGGLRAANTLYTAQPDGYTIGITNTIGLAAAQVSGQADFDLNEFTWIGRLNTESEMLLVGPDSEFESMEDLQNADRELRAAITSLGASTGVGAILIGDTYGFELVPVTHEGSSEARLSVIRGDTDFVFTALEDTVPEIEAGDLRPLLGVSQDPNIEALPDLRMASDDGHEDLSVALTLARDIAAPPGLPEDVRNTLAQAFTEAVEDPEFVAELEEAGFSTDPLNADETETAIEELVEVYGGYEDVLTAALGEER